ncbi:MAG TPA: DUF3309 family protein [Devosiaceae bacterium]|jgi:hypothetical protein|nr:DUF3309 family protein [Devosiaceae bacterium]
MIGFWVLLLLLIALVASAPFYPHSRAWGYWPATIIGILMIVWLTVIFIGFVAFALPWATAPAV